MIDIRQGDCLELMKDITDESIDLIVTDPPYKVISGGKPTKSYQPSGILSLNDGKIFKFNDIDAKLWFPELYRVLKNNSHCYIMTNLLNLKNYMELSEENGFKIHNLLVWEKK